MALGMADMNADMAGIAGIAAAITIILMKLL
jgi:hypothetical protein